jgi:hypothetical protein
MSAIMAERPHELDLVVRHVSRTVASRACAKIEREIEKNSAATPTGRLSVEEPENLRLSVALRATEKRPRSAVREPEQR